MKAVPEAIKTIKASISEICSCFGLTRDAYYKFFKRRKKREAVAIKVVKLVKEERKDQPRVGGRKLYEALHTLFILEGLKVGRDKLHVKQLIHTIGSISTIILSRIWR
jgi:hypothetical protein